MVKQPHESVKRGMGIQNTSEDLVNEGKIIVKKIKKKKNQKHTHTQKKPNRRITVSDLEYESELIEKQQNLASQFSYLKKKTQKRGKIILDFQIIFFKVRRISIDIAVFCNTCTRSILLVVCLYNLSPSVQHTIFKSIVLIILYKQCVQSYFDQNLPFNFCYFC